MKKFSLIILMLVLINNCASTARVQFTNGEDEDSKIARVVISPSLAVLSVDTVPPENSVQLDNRATGGLNKVFNVLPGKHILEIGFANNRFKATNTIQLSLEAKASDIIFLCYDLDNNLKKWKPRLFNPPKEKIATENVMGIFNIYLKDFADREQCFLQ